MVEFLAMVSSPEIQSAIESIKFGGVVAIPTDTLYGLAADATNPAAVDRVFEIKGRPANMPLPVLVSAWEQVDMVSTVAGHGRDVARILAERFWPGPLTLIVPARPDLPARLTGGMTTIGVRMPDHEVPLALAAAVGRPITGTSANPSGADDITEPEDLHRFLGGLVDGIIVSGAKPLGTASTIVSISDEGLTLLRAGALEFNDIQRAAATV